MAPKTNENSLSPPGASEGQIIPDGSGEMGGGVSNVNVYEGWWF